jgi:hypothetical protein
MENKEQLEQNQKEQPMSPIVRAIITGIAGGFLWSLLGYLAYLFSFTSLAPAIVLDPWAIGDWKDGVLGQFVGIFIIALLSIGVALLYYALLKKFSSFWASVGFGVGIWVVVFYLLNPIFSSMSPVKELSSDTIITTICLYILYGVFIGFSISFEHNEITSKHAEEEASYSNK